MKIVSTSLNSQGQITLPKEIRDQLDLKPGDRLAVATEGDRIIMKRPSLDLDDLCAVLPPPKQVATLDEIDAARRRR